jgi:hypothetical protein
VSYPPSRTEHGLQWLATNFSSGRIKRGLPERLECLAAFARTVEEAGKLNNGEPNDFAAAHRAYGVVQDRLRAAGVGPAEAGASPWCGPDL